MRLNLRKYKMQTETLRLEQYFGKKPTRSPEEIDETFSDLFTESTIDGLRQLTEDPSNLTETEQQALNNLRKIAELGFIDRQTREISAELSICRKSVRINFQNEILQPAEVFIRLKNETDSALRRELFQRLGESAYSCADLADENLLQTQEIIRKTGRTGSLELFEEITGVEFASLAKKARDFLAVTDRAYFRLLADLAAEVKLDPGQLSCADIFYISEEIERKNIYLGDQLSFFYAGLLDNFGFSPGRIPQIILTKTTAEKRTAMIAADLPEAVFLLVSSRDGADNYLEFLQQFGRAQHFAWTSVELFRRYPEFVFTPENVLSDGYGYLFRELLADVGFLRKSFFGGQTEPAEKIVRENNFGLLFLIRREVLRFLTELEICAAGRAGFEEIRRNAAQSFSENLGFEYRKEQIPAELTIDFSAQRNLRSLIFATGLREYLRGKYDFQWWQKRACFEELIDLWNTAGRYRAEELAGLVGFEMSFDLLAESFSGVKNL